MYYGNSSSTCNSALIKNCCHLSRHRGVTPAADAPARNVKLLALAITVSASGVSPMVIAGPCLTTAPGVTTCSGEATERVAISQSDSLTLTASDDFNLVVDDPQAAFWGEVTGGTGNLVLKQGSGTITQNSTATAVGARNSGAGDIIMTIGKKGDPGISGSLYADAQGGGDVDLKVYKKVLITAPNNSNNSIEVRPKIGGNTTIYAAEDIDSLHAGQTSRGILVSGNSAWTGDVDIQADGSVSGQAGGIFVGYGKDVAVNIAGDVTTGTTTLSTAGVLTTRNTGRTQINVGGNIISATGDGISAYTSAQGSGAQIVSVGKSVTATKGGGIAVTSVERSDPIKIKVGGNVSGNDYTYGGIYAYSLRGTGDISVNVGGDISADDGNGIPLKTERGGRGLTLGIDNGGAIAANVVGDITADTDGIYATSGTGATSTPSSIDLAVGGDIIAGRNGITSITTGAVRVHTGGNVTAGDALGIYVASTASGDKGGIIVEAMGDVTSGSTSNSNPEWTIYAYNAGTANSYILTRGNVTGGDIGVRAASLGDVVVDAHGLISGASGRAVDMLAVSGKSTLKLSDNWALNGQALAGNGTTDVLQLSGNTDSMFDLSTVGDSSKANGIVGFENLLKTDNATWILSGEQTQGAFASATLQSGTTVLDNARVLVTGSALDLQHAATLAVKGNSTIEGSVNAGGTISFNPTTPGSTLTVAGDYSGNNGVLKMNATLGDDASVTDKLVVKGNTSGSTAVMLNNAGGSGAKTLNGIELINVAGNSNGEFVQKGRIAAGAFDYNLVRGQGSDAKNWYLKSQVASPVEPVEPTEPTDPVAPISPPDSGSSEMILRPEGATYIANIAAANTLFMMDMHDRTEASNYIDPTTGKRHSSRLWFRAKKGHGHFNDSSGQLRTHVDHNVVQLGADPFGGSFNGADQWKAGLMAGYGSSESESHSKVTGYKSKGNVRGYSVGGYATWFSNADKETGSYVDTWATYGWFDNTVKGDGLKSEHYDSNGLTASVETGYGFKFEGAQQDYFIQPQAQVVWMGISADDHIEHNGTKVHDNRNKNVQTRLGARVSMRNKNKQNLELLLEVNWLHNSNGFGSNLDGVGVNQYGARNIGEMSLGLSGNVSKNVQTWGIVTQQIGENDYRKAAATVGLNIIF